MDAGRQGSADPAQSSSDDEAESTSGAKPEGSFSCATCGKRYVSWAGLGKHVWKHNHHPGKKQCKVCLKEFTSWSSLEVHLRVHADDKRFKCKQCLQSFSQYSQLKTHVCGHTGERSHKYLACKESFIQSAHPVHPKAVREQCLYKCDLCSSSFINKEALANHHNEHQTPQKCKLCGRVFKMRRHLKCHITKSHPEASVVKSAMQIIDYCDPESGNSSKTETQMIDRCDPESGNSNKTETQMIDHCDGSSSKREMQMIDHSDSESGNSSKREMQMIDHCDSESGNSSKTETQMIGHCDPESENSSKSEMHCDPESGSSSKRETQTIDHCDPESGDSSKDEASQESSGDMSPGVALKSLQCGLCQKYFKQSNHLSLHMRRTHGVLKRGARRSSSSLSSSESDVESGSDSEAQIEERPYKCDLCPRTFRAKSHMHCHRTKVHYEGASEIVKELPFRCDVCLRSFAEVGYLNLHRKKGHGLGPQKFPKPIWQERPHECKLCQKTFTSMKHLKIHMTRSAHFFQMEGDDVDVTDQENGSVALLEERPFQCNICQRRFRVPNGLVMHRLKTHKLKKDADGNNMPANIVELELLSPELAQQSPPSLPFECPVCGKRFKQAHHLKFHRMKSDHPVSENQCPACSEHFDSPFALKRHQSVHNAATRPQDDNTAEHEADEYPYECKICERRFKRINHFACHMKMTHHSAEKISLSQHSGEKREEKSESEVLNVAVTTLPPDPLPSCRACGTVFSHTGDLDAHSCTQTKQQPFKCHRCSKAYLNQRTLTTHIKICHAEEAPHKCDQCNTVFNLYSALLKHMDARHHGVALKPDSLKPQRDIVSQPLESHQKSTTERLLPLLLSTKTSQSLEASHRVLKTPSQDVGTQIVKKEVKTEVKESLKSPPRYKTFILQSDTLHAVSEPSSESDISEEPERKEHQFECCHCHVAFDSQHSLALHLCSSHLAGKAAKENGEKCTQLQHDHDKGFTIDKNVEEAPVVKAAATGTAAGAASAAAGADDEPPDSSALVVTWELLGGCLTSGFHGTSTANISAHPDPTSQGSGSVTAIAAADTTTTCNTAVLSSGSDDNDEVLPDGSMNSSSFSSPVSSSDSSNTGPSVVKTKIRNRKKAYRCEWCGRCFAHKSYLPEHYRIHQQVPHSCPLCNKVFNTPSYLRRHMRTVHKEFLY